MAREKATLREGEHLHEWCGNWLVRKMTEMPMSPGTFIFLEEAFPASSNIYKS